jgi:hypothetical protein
MNLGETFLLFVLMIVVFYFFGLIGIAVLGLIIALVYFATLPSEKSKKRNRMQRGTNIKPCRAHGLPNCPYCYPQKQKPDSEKEPESSEQVRGARNG